jgi:hypothetical protein
MLRIVIHDPSNLSLIHQAVGQRLGQSQSPVGSFQQEGAAVGTALSLIKMRDDGLRKNIGEQKTVCCRIATQAKASFGPSKYRHLNVFVP